MDTTRARAERDVLPARGASFLLEDGVLMFKFVIDTANTIGPRPAKPADAENYPAEWAAFKDAQDVASAEQALADHRSGAGDFVALEDLKAELDPVEPEPLVPSAAEDPAPAEAAASPVAEEVPPELPAEASADEPPAAETDGDAPAEADTTSTSRRRRAG